MPVLSWAPRAHLRLPNERARSGSGGPGTGQRRRPAHGRIRALDGLRGFAALAVVIHHSLLTGVVFAGTRPGGSGSRFPEASWWMTYTPLHLVWAGTEAVFIFFVLSGFVLVRATTSDGFAWRAYFPARLIRLYVPVAGALVLAAVVTELVHRTREHGASWWLNAHAAPVTGAGLFHDAVLVLGTNWVVSALWSLKWEVLFSILLPVAALAGGRRLSTAFLQVTLFLLSTGIGARTGHQGLMYLPMFGIGAVLARHADDLRARAEQLTDRGWLLLSGASVVLLTSSWTFHDPLGAWWIPAETLGATVAVVIFAFWRRARALAEAPRAQWLGKRSFSLYLVHEPVVVSVALLLGRPAGGVATVLIAVPLSLLVAQLFFVCVERPSHRAARAVGDQQRGLPAPQPA